MVNVRHWSLIELLSAAVGFVLRRLLGRITRDSGFSSASSRDEGLCWDSEVIFQQVYFAVY